MYEQSNVGVEVRGQLLEVSFLLPPFEFWELNSSHQVWC